VLLQVFRDQRDQTGTEHNQVAACAISDACIRCARHSCTLLTQCWINGSFHGLDFFYTEFLFSAATILAISSVLSLPKSHDDAESFEIAVDLLEQLKQSGSFCAADYCSQMDEIRIIIRALAGQDKSHGRAMAHASLEEPSHTFDTETATPANPEWALADQSLQDFLTSQDLDLEFFNGPVYDGNLQELYWQPQL
jgi:proline utilization trans-activator